MKNKIQGGFFAYLLVFLGIALTVTVVCCALMIISPGMTIFGYSYLTKNASANIKTVDVAGAQTLLGNLDIERISISHNTVTIGEDVYDNAHYDVNVIKNNDTTLLSVIVEDRIKGFTNKLDNRTTSVGVTFDTTLKSLNIVVTEPVVSMYLSKRCKITISLPNNYNSSSIDFVASTNNGSIHIGGATVVVLKSIDIQTKTGDVSLHKDSIINGGNVSMKTESGDVSIGNLTNNQMIGKNANIVLQTNSGKLNAGNMIGNVSVISKNSAISVGNVTGDLTLDSESGSLYANNVSGNFTATENVKSTNIILKEIGGETLVPSSENSDVTIDKISNRTRIKTKFGKILIKNIAKEAVLETEKGEIEFTALTSNIVTAKTKSGKITANFKNIQNNHTLTTESGKIYLNFNTGLNVKINVVTGGEIRANWDPDYLGRTEFSVTRGTDQFTMTVASTSGNVYLEEKAI